MRNHIAANDIGARALPAGTADRRALAIAGDDADAKATVTAFIDSIGFDVVDSGAPSEGWRFHKDHPAYIARLDAAGLKQALADAKRYRDM